MLKVASPHSPEWDRHTRSGGTGTPARVGHTHSLGWACLIRARRDPYPERDATIVPSETRPLSRARRNNRPERDATIIPSETQPSSRARRDHHPERDATLVPSETRGSSNTAREVRATRLERFEQHGSTHSSREGTLPRAGNTLFPERGMQSSPLGRDTLSRAKGTPHLKTTTQQTLGFLGATAPKRREEVGRGIRRGAGKLLRTVSLPLS